MSPLEPLLRPTFLVVAGLWSVLSLYALLDRARYDVRHRSVRVARGLLGRPALQALPPRERASRVEWLLSRLPRRTIDRVAGDSSVPSWLAEAFSIFALRKWGAKRLVSDASFHDGETSRFRRVAALRILAQARHPELLPLLCRALADRDPRLVGTAVSLLGHLPDRRAAQRLVGALRARRYAPSRIATSLDRLPLDIADLLVPLLTHPHPAVRFWGATLIGRYRGVDGLDAKLGALAEDPDPNVRKAAVESLGKMGGPAAASTALRLLDDPVWYVKAHAARALGDLRRIEAAPRIIPLLADPQWWVRLAVKDALEAMGADVWPQLVPCLDHADPFARNGAAEVLQNIGILDVLLDEAVRHAPDPESVQVLRKAVAAGGGRFLEGLLGRANPETMPRIEKLVRELGLEAVKS